jgi:hypothetical protein
MERIYNQGIKSRDPQGSDQGKSVMGEASMLKGGLALFAYDGTVLGCTGKHCLPDPVLIGAVEIPSCSRCPFGLGLLMSVAFKKGQRNSLIYVRP